MSQIPITLLLYSTNLYWYLLNFEQMLLNSENVDFRWLLETIQGKLNGEPNLAVSAPVPNMKQYPSFSARSKSCLHPSMDSGVACQIWTSGNLVHYKKKQLASISFIYLFIYLTTSTCQDPFRIRFVSPRRYVNMMPSFVLSIPLFPRGNKSSNLVFAGLRS